MSSPRHKGRIATPTTAHSVPAIVGVAALLVAGLGAAELAREHDAAAAAEPAAAAAHAPAVHLQQERAARRAEVVEASRSDTRPDLRTSEATEDRVADRGAEAREQALRDLARAAEQRSTEIHRQEVRERRRERQRRIERMNRWVVPVSDYDITATFGAGGSMWSSDHTGLDLAASPGSPVGSAAMGEVTSTGYDDSYGNKVVVTHEDGTKTWYCHLSSIAVDVGESVRPGTTIGTVGSTGNSTGPHLHLEVRPGGGGPVDPYSYLQEQGAL